MPPKPRPVRKQSAATAPNNANTTANAAKNIPTPSTSMPPPPAPVKPLGILEAEVTALSSCLQNAVIKTGQVYGFYTDVQRLGIQQYATRPPRSLTSSLGREIVQYDQLCDAMESHLLRAISVLQRDMDREERRIKAEEEAAAAKAASPSAATATTPPGSPTPSTQTDTQPDGSSRNRLPNVGTNVARRPSTISLSSLSRPAFPHKLDLSASALRIHPEEMIPSGLSSPVTLAPRSARASLPPELVMAALGDAATIDLTVDTDMDMTGPGGPGQISNMVSLDPALGSSADKPIELDLDMDMDMGFFTDGAGSSVSNANTSMFVPDSAGQQLVKPKEEHLDIDLLSSFPDVEHPGSGDDLFASLGGTSAGPPSTVSELQKEIATMASHSAMLASLGGSSHPPASTGTTAMSEGVQGSTFSSLFDMNEFSTNFSAENASGSGVDIMEAYLRSLNQSNDPSTTMNNTS